MPNLRQQTPFVSANEKAPSHGAGLTKCRTSKFPKIYKYPVQLFTSVLISVRMSLFSNFNSKLIIQTVAFLKRRSQTMDKPLYFQTYLFVQPSILTNVSHNKACFRPIFSLLPSRSKLQLFTAKLRIFLQSKYLSKLSRHLALYCQGLVFFKMV